MDKVVAKISAFGVPGLILLIAIGTTGLFGAAAITTALAALGGPFGMLGGIALLGIAGLIAHSIAEYGADAIIKAVIKDLLKKERPEAIKKKVQGYLISNSLKLKIIKYIDENR